jgi:hypothetical protein
MARDAGEQSLAVVRRLVATVPSNAAWQADLVLCLWRMSAVVERVRARELLQEALAIVERLANEGQLAADQQAWPQLIRDQLAKLPPAQAETR